MKAQAFLASVAALFMSLSSQAHTIVNDFDCSKLPKQTQVAEPLKYDVEIEQGPGLRNIYLVSKMNGAVVSKTLMKSGPSLPEDMVYLAGIFQANLTYNNMSKDPTDLILVSLRYIGSNKPATSCPRILNR